MPELIFGIDGYVKLSTFVFNNKKAGGGAEDKVVRLLSNATLTSIVLIRCATLPEVRRLSSLEAIRK